MNSTRVMYRKLTKWASVGIIILLAVLLTTGGILIDKYKALESQYEELSASTAAKQWHYSDNKNWRCRVEGFQASGLPDVDILFLGDSLIEMWPTDLMFNDYIIMNQGISGDVTEGVLARIELAKCVDAEIVVLIIGTNDFTRGFDSETITDNVRGICENLSSSKIMLLSLFPTPADESELQELHIVQNIAYSELADSFGNVTFVDLFSEFTDNVGFQNQSLFVDKEHLTAMGYEKLTEILRNEINSM